MNEYIFYTDEGYTAAPDRTAEVENCQVLGRAEGSSPGEALKNLLSENPWINDAGFDISRIYTGQLLSGEQRKDILSLLNCLKTNGPGTRPDGNIRIGDIIKKLETV